MDDVISRKWLMECVEEGWIKFETEKDENKFIHLVRDIAPSVQPTQKGWICPVCGRGLSPLTMVCPCQNGKGLDIT